MDKESNVVNIVNSAHKPASKNKGNGGGGSGSGSSKVERFGSYMILNGAFHQLKPVQSGKDGGGFIEIVLCNFTCRITEEVVADDGLSDTTFLKIEGRRADGKLLPAVDVPLKSFFSSQGNWCAEAWGMLPYIPPGAAKKDNLRACIQLYSQLDGDILRRTVYKYIGWKKINDSWHYLTGSGAITANGLIESVQVDLGPGHMALYSLPAPLAGEQLKQAVNDALLLLNVCPDKPRIGFALLAAIARAPLGECKPTDFAIWLHGLTGSRKSALAGVAQAFFGRFSSLSFPANWADTANDIEAKAHQAKDAFFTIDDYKPVGGEKDVKQLEKQADRLVRGTGNQSGRGRRGSGMESKAAPYNRSMTLITGEDLAPGQSLIGRLLVMEITQTDVDNAVLSRLQAAASEGRLAGLMSAYLKWLAPRLDQLKKDFPAIVTHYRDAAQRDKIATSHSRAPEIYANLVAGAETFLDFLDDVGAITNEHYNELLSDTEANLQQAFGDQSRYQVEQDEGIRFIELLRAALTSGNAHIADRNNQKAPSIRPHSFGWIKSEGLGDSYTAKGDLIGWYVGPKNDTPAQIWLQKDVAYSVAQRCSTSQKQTFHSGSMGALWKMMLNKGWLEADFSDGTGTPRPTVRKYIDGIYHRVLVIRSDLLLPPGKDEDE